MKSQTDLLTIADKQFSSRLMLGTGKYKTSKDALLSIKESECEIVTVAVRRLPTNLENDSQTFLNDLDCQKIWLLPNTAGSQTADEAIRMAFLGHELAVQANQKDNFFVKLEVISDPKYLLPDPVGTLKAAEFLVRQGFTVLPYINADPILALHLEDLGCKTVMPLASPIGSGQGLKTIENIKIIIENATVPVVVDAGISSPSEAALAMELGADAVLMNTAIAQSNSPAQMARAMKLSVEAGRLCYLAGKMKGKRFASPSSPPINYSQLQ